MFDHTPAVKSRSRHIDKQRDNSAVDSSHDRPAGWLGGRSDGLVQRVFRSWCIAKSTMSGDPETALSTPRPTTPVWRAQQLERIG
jgi:hypothetical protein